VADGSTPVLEREGKDRAMRRYLWVMAITAAAATLTGSASAGGAKARAPQRWARNPQVSDQMPGI